jgi:Sec7-like guanine-nucleotide exchange factor
MEKDPAAEQAALSKEILQALSKTIALSAQNQHTNTLLIKLIYMEVCRLNPEAQLRIGAVLEKLLAEAEGDEASAAAIRAAQTIVG